MRVAVIMACFNRSPITRKCIQSLEENRPPNWQLTYFVFDDGSNDGTANMLRSLPINLVIKIGNGNFYWAKSMATSMKDARLVNPDAYLLLNDDVCFKDKKALLSFQDSIRKHNGAAIVGQLIDPTLGEISYGGLKRNGRHPFRTNLDTNNSHDSEIDTFHGNFVYVPKQIVETVGYLDGKYQHAYADFDYGYRIKKAGFQIILSATPVGECSKNNTLTHPNFTGYLRNLLSRKGRPLRSQIRFARKHGGPEWPIYVISGYLIPIIRYFQKNVQGS